MVKNMPVNAGDQVLVLGKDDHLEKETAIHSSTFGLKNSIGKRSLAGYNPWGNKRVGQDLATTQGLLLYLV